MPSAPGPLFETRRPSARDQRERNEVDRADLEPCGPHRADQSVDGLLVRRGDEDAVDTDRLGDRLGVVGVRRRVEARGATIGAVSGGRGWCLGVGRISERGIGRGRCDLGRRADRDRFEDLEVEDRVVERDRNQLTRLEADRAREVGVGHRRHVDRTNDHAGPGDPEPHLTLLETELPPQTLDRGRHRRRVEHLSLAHRVDRKRDLTEGPKCDLGVELDLGDTHHVGADVEADHAAAHAYSPPAFEMSEIRPSGIPTIRASR